ncbi:MAG: 3-oxoacyl-ACP reductase family protein [Nannocystales bacterium]
MEPSNALPASLDLSGRRALVTGGSRGIGRAIAITLASRGAAVAVNYARGEAAAREVVGAIEDAGGTAVAVGFDVSDADAVTAGFKQVTEALGGLDILVNNAGISIDALLMRAKEEDWETLQRVNLRGTLLCSKAATRSLLRAKSSGRIINLTSVVGEQGNAGQTMYAATKAGVIGMTKSIARELASRGCTVNAVAPGFIATDMTDAALVGDARDTLIGNIPLGRIGATNDIAESVAFLASDAAGYITGHVLRVNGGLHI